MNSFRNKLKLLMTCSLRPRNLATYCFISVRLYLLTVYNKKTTSRKLYVHRAQAAYMQWRVHLAKNLTFVTKRSFTFRINKWHIYSTLSNDNSLYVRWISSSFYELTCLLHLAIYELFIAFLIHIILSLFLFLCEWKKWFHSLISVRNKRGKKYFTRNHN